MKRFIPYLLFSLFSFVFAYEAVEVLLSEHHSCYTDMESNEKEKGTEEPEKNEKEGKEKEEKSGLEGKFLPNGSMLLSLFDHKSSILYRDHLSTSTNYRKTAYPPPEH